MDVKIAPVCKTDFTFTFYDAMLYELSLTECFHYVDVIILKKGTLNDLWNKVTVNPTKMTAIASTTLLLIQCSPTGHQLLTRSQFFPQIYTGDSRTWAIFIPAWGSNWGSSGFPVIKVTTVHQVRMSPASTAVWTWR